MDLKSLLESLFGRHVDLVLPGSLKPRLRDRIAKDVHHYATDYKISLDDLLEAVDRIEDYTAGMERKSSSRPP